MLYKFCGSDAYRYYLHDGLIRFKPVNQQNDICEALSNFSLLHQKQFELALGDLPRYIRKLEQKTSLLAHEQRTLTPQSESSRPIYGLACVAR